MTALRTRRLAAATAALALLLAAAVGYVVYAADRGAQASAGASGDDADASTSAANLRSVLSAGPYYVFQSSALDRDYGRVAVVARSDPARRVFVAGLHCNRLAVRGGRGLCLQLTPGLTVGMEASVLDQNLAVTRRLSLPGYPSRTQVAPDGRLAAATAFVSGDSYAAIGFSTRTSVIDLTTGNVLFDLEKLAVTRNGRPFRAADFNFWGVTFQQDSHHFYATLGSGGQTYLIHGDVTSRTASVVTTGVECPSLSPDGRLIAFKKRVSDNPVTWRLWVLDLATGQQHATTETRPVDDQAGWLDDHTITYGLAAADGGTQHGGANPSAIQAGSSVDTATWTVRADGTGSPHLLLDHAWSAQLGSRPGGSTAATP